MRPARDFRRTAVARRARLAAAALLGGVLTAAASAAVAASSADTSAPLLDPQAPVSAAQSDQTSSFGVLRGAQAPVDAFAGSAQPAGGANPQLARSVAVPTSALSTGRVWVVPGNGVLCLRVIDPAGGEGWTCSTTAAARAGGLVGTIAHSLDGGGPVFAFGLVPDGVGKVTIDGPGGAATTLSVSNNVYATTVAATPVSVRFSAAGGEVATVPLT